MNVLVKVVAPFASSFGGKTELCTPLLTPGIIWTNCPNRRKRAMPLVTFCGGARLCKHFPTDLCKAFLFYHHDGASHSPVSSAFDVS